MSRTARAALEAYIIGGDAEELRPPATFSAPPPPRPGAR